MHLTHLHPSLLRSVRSRVTIALCLGALLLALPLALLPSGQRADALGYSALVDEPARYEGQVICTSTAQPGTRALARYLLWRYPSTKSMGMMRGCGVGGTSEHKDGRAFDWGADVSRSTTKSAAYHFIRAALATDSAGNRSALARRLGIMYLIYNDTIWSSSRDFEPKAYLHRSCTTRAKCSRTLRHLDHVHISLGYGGAAAQTSWYRQRNVPFKAVLYPWSTQLDPDNTAVAPGFNVPATGARVSSPYRLKAGVTYRVVVTGSVRYGPGTAIGDANCSRSEDGLRPLLTDRGPLPEPPPEQPDPWDGDWNDGWDDGWDGGWDGNDAGSDHEDSPGALPVATTHGLTLNGKLRWEGGCRANRTYQAWFTPGVTQQLTMQYVDADPSDNSGSLRVYVARDDITLTSLVR